MRTMAINQKNDEMRHVRVWQSRTMIGTWDGIGRWNDGNQWNGLGTWQGGLISGTWNGKGKWEPLDNGKGNWNGNGDLISNMSFRKYSTPIYVMKGFAAVAAIGLVFSVTSKLVSNWLFIGEWIAFIFLICTTCYIIGRRETAKGKWWGEGTWEDDGEFRILNITGTGRLGYHKGTIKGKMKDLIR